MIVNEIFRSIQGEGPLIGTPCVFIRFAGCNLRCIYCDTKYTWTEGIELSVDNIMSKVERLRPSGWIIITGGEPFTQSFSELDDLFRKLSKKYSIAIETNASINIPKELLNFVDIVIASPKLKSFNPWYPGAKLLSDTDISKLWLKFVITNLDKDFNEIEEYVYKGISLDRVIVQPNWYVLKYYDLAKYVLDKNLPYRILPQLHKLVGLP